MSKIISKYLKKVLVSKPNATEFTFRTPLENLLNDVAVTEEVTRQSREVTIMQEPSREKGVGAPDFLLLNEGGAIIGYVECKKIGEDLDKLIGSKQLQKYGNLSNNVLLTDYQRFILLQNDNPPRTVDLSASAVTSDDKKLLQSLIVDFMSAEIRRIDDPKKLAAILAERCKALRKQLEKELSDTSENNITARALIGLFSAFKTTLYHDITLEKFADALAQTVTYTLLMAKLKSPLAENKLDIYGLKRHIPKNFALVRDISGFLENLQDTPLKYLLDSILAVINAIDRYALTERSGKSGGTDEDPYFYFYENFLAEYDEKMRKFRGVYYTPPPAVKFIVRATNDILRRDFGTPEGLADSSVTALDFAAGTGAFMLEIIRQALEGKSKAKRDSIAHSHLLKNIFGFELLIAPYVIAHLKLSAFLSEMGINIREDERINVFLTNTLEKTPPQTLPIIIPALTEEVERAQKIKEQDILVIVGNPPYSVHGQNNGVWIQELLRDYYQVDGEKLKERNPKALQDDYVKFIRFAQHKISEFGHGVVAIITNHGFLDNPTFRGMRQSLFNTFDRMYFLDLHGNSKKREIAPDGGKDKNIFDIQQGVAISLLVKNPELTKGVFRADFWGSRADKEKACLEYNINDLSWEEIYPSSPFYLFIPQDRKVRAKYEKFYPLTKIFSAYSAGIVTARDALTIQLDQKRIKNVVEQFANMPPEEARSHFNLGPDTRDWKVDLAQEDLRESGLSAKNYRSIACRPFDICHTYYTGKSRGFHCMPRDDIMRHMIAGNNIGLVSVRQVAESHFSHAFVSDKIINYRMTLSNRGGAYLFPLYRNETDMGKESRRENFTVEFRSWINNRYGKEHTPEDILGCIYAILNAPDYRQQYIDFLRLDYPRIPFPQNNKSFSRLAKIGNELMNVHLLRTHCDNKIKLCGDGTSHIVEQVCYNENEKRLYFNKDEYLASVTSEVFNFEIGGYKPLVQFLKYRKGQNIGTDIEALEKAANAIAFTVNAVKKIVLP